MKRIIFVMSVLFLISNTLSAQKNLNAYKYIIVPKTYKALKEMDRYRMNSLTKFLFNKYGFNALIEGDVVPKDLLNNPCLGVSADISDESSMFVTKFTVDLIDCYNNKVFSSRQGISKIKEYKESYQAALRDAFLTFEKMEYKFNPALVVNNNNVAENKAVISFPLTQIKSSNTEPKPKKVTTTPSKQKASVAAKSYKNKDVSFLLIEQNQVLKAYVKNTNTDSYKNGELIGTFTKTSLANVYRLVWKSKQGKLESTTAYFDEAGNLKVDIEKNGAIEVLTFKLEN